MATPPALRTDEVSAPVRVDPCLLAEVQRYGGFDPSCLNCGGCSVVCELTYDGVTFPRRPIRRVVLGLRQDVLEGLEPWLCHDCGDCSLTCPRQADPAESMRTLRRFLTGQYDGTGLASRILRSRAWHLGSLAFVGALVLGLVLLYHLHWGGLALGDFATTSTGLEHMFPKILYFTWIVYGLPGLFLLVHVRRMYRFTMGRTSPPLRLFLAELWSLVLQMTTQREMRKCPAQARTARAFERWRQEEGTPGVDFVPRRWLKHWLMALGTVMMFVLTAAFLRWFQTDALHPLYHPQRWVGYLATALILWGTTDILLRYLRRRTVSGRKRGPLALPLLLWLTALSGLAVHVLRYFDLALAAHYAYALHLVILVPMVVVEVPFGEWAHMIDRPLALHFQAVLERARAAAPSEAGLVPARA